MGVLEKLCDGLPGLRCIDGSWDEGRLRLRSDRIETAAFDIHACLHCGLLWHHLDPRQLIANTSRYGLAPHRTAVMESAALQPQKFQPHS